jgi:hypothetical protein
VFVQTTTSKRKGGKTYVSYLVRESFRTPQGPRSRTVCNITDLPLHTRDLISASLKGQSFVAPQSVQLHEALDYGGLAVLNHTWQRFEMDRLLAAMGSARQQKLLKAMIYARLLFPCAKLSLKVQAQGTWLPEACGLTDESFDEDDLYEAMDQMNGQWVKLERTSTASFSNGLRLTLYDLTSTYFEGKGPRGWPPTVIAGIIARIDADPAGRATDPRAFPCTFRSCGATAPTTKPCRGSCGPCAAALASARRLLFSTAG